MAPDFFLWRFVAEHPVRVRLRELTGHRVLGERAVVLLGGDH